MHIIKIIFFIKKKFDYLQLPSVPENDYQSSVHTNPTTTIDSDEGFGSQCETAKLNSNDQPKINIIPKRVSSIPTSNSLNRNIQRCAVSRRISNEKVREEIHLVSSKSNNQITRPLRAYHMPTIITNDSSVKSPRKSSSILRLRHQLTIEKTFTSRTILTNVLPSLKNPKNNNK